MPLLEIKDFNALLANKLSFDQSVKTKQEDMKNLFKCPEMITIQQGTCKIICTNKI